MWEKLRTAKWFTPLICALVVAAIIGSALAVLNSGKTTIVTTTTTLPPSTVTLPPRTVTQTVVSTAVSVSTTTVPPTTVTKVVTSVPPPSTTTATVTVTPTTTVITTQPVVTSTVSVTVTPLPVTTTVTIPQLMFIGNITVDSNVVGSIVEGVGGATFTVGSSQHQLGISSASAANLANGNYGFYLQATIAQKASLVTYFTNVVGLTGIYLTDIIDEIYGNKPFFILSVSGSTFNVYDGFQTQLGNATKPLVISGGYPASAYVYTGVLTGTNGASNLSITITLTIQ